MPVTLRVSVEGMDRVMDKLNGINPQKNPALLRRSLITCAELVQKISAEEMIIRGSRFRGPAGPRGGKGKLVSAGVHPTKLTSRHGGEGIVGSIRVNRSPLPYAIEVGSDRVYAPVHEFGGTFFVRQATSSRSGGSIGYSATYPPRPFLQPALEKAAKSFSAIFAKELEKEIRK